MSHEVHEDGELDQLNNFLASQQQSSQTLTEIQIQEKETKLKTRTKMHQVMMGLEIINRGVNGKLTHKFIDKEPHSNKEALLINAPLFEKTDDELNIKYLIATSVGFGYLSYFVPERSDESNSWIDPKFNLYSSFSPINSIKTFPEIAGNNSPGALQRDQLRTLNAFLSAPESNPSWVNKYQKQLKILEVSDVTFSADLILIQQGSSPTEEWETCFEIDMDYDQKFNVKEDLETILTRLSESSQNQIDIANRSLSRANNKLEIADSAIQILGDEAEIHDIKEQSKGKRKRFGIF